MSEWWTYSLADFLMFSSRTYWRLIASTNQALWPGHVIAFAGGLAILGCLLRPGPAARRLALLLLAAAWGWTGWAYQLERYADINTAGPYFAVAFALQALVLCVLAAKPNDAQAAPAPRRAGVAMCALAALAYPLLAVAAGRPWVQAEVFGIVPDPTAMATLGALLALRAHWTAWPIPLVWCAASGATLMELRIGHAWLLPLSATCAAVLALWYRKQSP